MAVPEQERILITETSNGRLYMYWEEYRSHMYLHLRYWYQDKKTQEWKPGAKGIGIPKGNLKLVLEGFKRLLSNE